MGFRDNNFLTLPMMLSPPSELGSLGSYSGTYMICELQMELVFVVQNCNPSAQEPKEGGLCFGSAWATVSENQIK